MRIGIIGDFVHRTGSQYRAAELCNGFSAMGHECYLIGEKGINKGIDEYLHESVNRSDEIGRDLVESLDIAIVINGSSFKYSKAKFWSSKADLSKVGKVAIVYNFALRPAQYLYTLSKLNEDITIFTANSTWAKILGTQERYRKTREMGFPVHVIESPIPAKFDVDRVTSEKIRIGRLAWSHANKFNIENVELVKRVKSAYPDLEFKFVGVPDEHHEEMSEYAELHAEFTIPPEQFYANTDIVLYYVNWDWPETWPRVIAEAMMAGCCVVTNNIGGMKDQIEHCETGYLCNSLDGFEGVLKMLASNPARILEVGNAAREKAREQFSTEVVLNKMLKAMDASE